MCKAVWLYWNSSTQRISNFYCPMRFRYFLCIESPKIYPEFVDFAVKMYPLPLKYEGIYPYSFVNVILIDIIMEHIMHLHFSIAEWEFEFFLMRCFYTWVLYKFQTFVVLLPLSVVMFFQISIFSDSVIMAKGHSHLTNRSLTRCSRKVKKK